MRDWPKRAVVDLDNLGDPGAWLADMFDTIEVALNGDPPDVVEGATGLAEAYYQELEAQAYQMPSDFDDEGPNPEADIKQFTEEFFQFLVEWRRRVNRFQRV